MKNFFIASQFEADFFLDDFNQVDNNIYEKDCRIIITGIGLVNTAISCTKFFMEYGTSEEDEYINIGIAGAVNPKFQLGQVLEASHFSVFNALNSPESSKQILDKAYPEITDGDLRLISSPTPVWGKQNLQKLQSLNIDLVDMEAYSFVKVCREFEASYKVLKSVSDHLHKKSQDDFLENAKNALMSLKKYIKTI